MVIWKLYKSKTLKKFKEKYLTLTEQIYSKNLREKSILPKFARLNWFSLISIAPKEIHLLTNSKACGLLVLKHRKGYLGYLEGLDENSLSKIITKAQDIVKESGYKEMFAPVDLSIWHSHRLNLSSPFKNFKKEKDGIYNEPNNPDFYKKCLEENSFNIKTKYLTTKAADIKQKLEKINKKLAPNPEYSIKKIDLKIINLKYFYKIYQSSKSLFLKVPGFFNIGLISFLWLYLNPTSYKIDHKFLYGCFHKSELVGFCYFYVQEVDYQKSMIFKTIAIDKQHQGSSCFWLLNQKVYEICLEHEVAAIYYTFMLEGNKTSQIISKQSKLYAKYGLFCWQNKSPDSVLLKIF
jgi:uncharacterized protein YqgV (UPF0045/DUF77 family)